MIKHLHRSYVAWRVYDAKSMIIGKNIACPKKLEIAPAQLVKVFGPPCYMEEIPGTSGTYDFEDETLSLYKLIDRYEVKDFIRPRELTKKYPSYSHRNKQGPFPSTDEFWSSEKLYKFWLLHS